VPALRKTPDPRYQGVVSGIWLCSRPDAKVRPAGGRWLVRIVWLVASALAFALAGCGPDIPNTPEHQDVGEDDCVVCHFGGAGTTPPDSHFDGDGPDSSHEACLKCHSFAN